MKASWEKATQRGVKFKYIICGRPKGEKFEPDLGLVFKNSDYFKISWDNSDFRGVVLLVDEKEEFCRMGANVESPVLWSANPIFVAMIKDHLEIKWRSLE